MKNLFLATAGCAALMTATSATAADLLFEFDAVDPADDFQFIFDSDPEPASSGLDSFTIVNVPASNAGGDFVFSSLVFFTSGNSGGFNDFPDFSFNFAGPQLFSGSVSDPTFLTGSFALVDFSTGAAAGTLNVGSAVPEPATWALMLLGFFAIGSSMRRKNALSSVRVSYS